MGGGVLLRRLKVGLQAGFRFGAFHLIEEEDLCLGVNCLIL